MAFLSSPQILREQVMSVHRTSCSNFYKMSRQVTHQKAVQEVNHAEVAEFMVTSLDGSMHPALLATPGSGIIVNAKGPSADPECLGEDVLG